MSDDVVLSQPKVPLQGADLWDLSTSNVPWENDEQRADMKLVDLGAESLQFHCTLAGGYHQ